jgi:threonylcarbamoyladenosine tRNA methylthiotransferase MtaB
MLHILSEKKKRSFYESQVGQSFTVLFEDDVEEGNMYGFTENYVKVTAKYDPLRVNETVKVLLSGINESGLGEVEEIAEEVFAH